MITVNKNVVCEPHRDGNNAAESWICFLGDFTGGELVFEDGTEISEPRKWHRIKANQLLHWNKPITSGTKYSVILYKRACKPGLRSRKDPCDPSPS